VEVAVSEVLLVAALLSMEVSLSLAEWFNEPFRLKELVLLFVTSEVVVVSS
jgi:hypothetical protein